MNHPSRKVTTPSSKKKHAQARIVKRAVKQVKKPKNARRSRLSSLLAIAILLAAMGLVATFTWLSFLYIFQPHQITWINRVLPGWFQVPWQGERPQSLLNIRDSLRKEGLVAGKLIALNPQTKNNSSHDKFLLPIYRQRPNCTSDCREMRELRIYQVSTDAEFTSKPEKYYYSISQTQIMGPEEAFVVAPLANATNANPGANINLPLTGIKQFSPQSAPPGFWFYLHGSHQDGIHNFSYGQVFHYSSKGDRLRQMLAWTSPRGNIPEWVEVAGGGLKELVVDAGVGLEPDIRIFQVKTAKSSNYPTALTEVRLQPPAWQDKPFKDALRVARSGLWSPGWQWLQFIQKQKGKKIPVPAQAQIALVRLHAAQTKAQADRDWASPAQEVLADLIDGRWSQALSVLENSTANASEISRLLKADGGRLWSRVTTALGVNPKRQEVQIWGALILAAQTNEKKAIAWVKSQPQVSSQTVADMQIWFRRLRGEAVITNKAVGTSPHTSQIIGSATPLSQINTSDWLSFDRNIPLRVTDTSQWYAVDVTAFVNPQGWLYDPFSNLKLPGKAPEKYLTDQLGLNSSASLQIVTWSPNGQQNAIAAIIRAAQLRGGKLRLLAVTDAINVNQINIQGASQPLAVSVGALQWLPPAPVTLLDLIQSNPQRAERLLSGVWRELQASAGIKGKMPSLSELGQKIGHWPLQNVDITQNQQPETILTISPPALKSLQPGIQKSSTRPMTLIVSATGKILYSNLSKSSQNNLTAIATLGGTNTYTLLVEGKKGYYLKRWSPQNQRFE